MEFSTEGLEDIMTSPAAETDGIRVHIEGPVHLYMRRAGGANSAYDRARSKRFRRVRRRIDTMSNQEILDEIVKPSYLDAVIIGWEGVKDAKGQVVPFSRKACQDWLDAFPNAWDLVLSAGDSMEAFSQARYDEAAAEMGKS